MLRPICVIGLIVSCFLMAAGQDETPQTDSIVHNITLSNVRAISTVEQQRILRDVLSQVKTRIPDKNQTYFDAIAERIRYEFQTVGYFKVFVKDPVVKVIGKDGEREIVDIDISVDEGEQYRLKDLQFTNETVFSVAELRTAFSIADGDIFNREKIAAGLESLRRLYGTKGYVNFSAVPETSIDEHARSISLTVYLDEGSVFRLGTLTVRGVESEPGARAKLLSTWNSYQGRVFDFKLLPQFLKDIGARAEVKPEQVFETSQDANARVVNVFITLAKPPLF